MGEEDTVWRQAGGKGSHHTSQLGHRVVLGRAAFDDDVKGTGADNRIENVANNVFNAAARSSGTRAEEVRQELRARWECPSDLKRARRQIERDNLEASRGKGAWLHGNSVPGTQNRLHPVLGHRLDERPFVTKHIKQWRAQPMCQLVVPILIPCIRVQQIRWWMDPPKVIIGGKRGRRLARPFRATKQPLQRPEKRTHNSRFLTSIGCRLTDRA